MAPKTRRDINFARLVAEIQAAAGLDDEALAALLGVHRTTVLRLRTGDRTDPSYALGAELVRMHDSRPRGK